MKKNIAIKITSITIASALGFLSACGGSSATSQNTPETPSASPQADITPEVSALLESHCSQRPIPSTINANRNGQNVVYTEVLAERTDGHQLSSGTHLLATNKVGNLILKPSTDGRVAWGAREWVLAPSQSEANAALNNITITSQVLTEEARVLVDHPNSEIPGNRYQVCLVVMAPPEWLAQLENGTGNILSDTHEGALTIHNNTGNITITQNGPGFITATNDTGNITATGDSRGGANLSTDTGSIHYTLNDGGLALQNASRLQADTGNITLSLQDGFGINLSAHTIHGNLTAPPSFPEPTHNALGEHLQTDINGGGAVLIIQNVTGNVIISDL